MEYSKQTLEELYAKMSIEDEEEGGVIIASEKIVKKEACVLVGRFLTEKNINFMAMQNVLASLWRPKEGFEIHDIGEMRYTFVFYHPTDLQKVLDGGPWSFEQSLLIHSEVKENDDPKGVKLEDTEIWMQVYDLPNGFISENIFQSIGNYIGAYIKFDPANYDGFWKAYVRIRVRMNVTKPLKRRMKIKRSGGEWSWINFKYERLSTFCFVCGILGHGERDCNVVYANAGKVVDKAYGTWLRAPGRAVKNNTGAKWLRNGGGGGSHWAGNTIQTDFSDDKRRKEDTLARFQETYGNVSEYQAEMGSITVLANNQGLENVTNRNSNQKELESNKRKVENVCRMIHFADCFVVDSQGQGGGLALLWKNAGSVEIKGSCNHYIDFEVVCEQLGRWRYRSFYGCPERYRRHESWDLLRGLAGDSNLPWCVVGDFNDMMFAHEKEGGRPHPRALLDGFTETVYECGLVDMGFLGNEFTWERSRGQLNWIHERLGRGEREIVPHVTEEQTIYLMQPTEQEEVKAAIFSMHPEKSPGEDGLNPAFYQMYWSIVGKDVVKFFADFFERGEMQPEGKVFGEVKPERGIRQGDPISPYLYILCAEGLSSMLRRNEEAGLIHGGKIANGAPRVSHLLFADDCYLFFKATVSEAIIMKNVLKMYEGMSGQAIYFNKSSITFSPNTVVEDRRRICEALEVDEVDTPGKYLGIPMEVGRKKKEVFGFLTDKVKQKLQVWSNKGMSKAGKYTLLKTAGQVVPNFWMNLMTIPAEVCNVMQIQMNKFWWGNGGQNKGVKWMAWGKMCEEKESGGLGYKDL
ncbi:uncharacterized protein LOC141679304 [Apium graveolens]|uniref:uncharacterized protein LOC141679304 n=1 Tax=Apium graveolens TaxID=4045 RepID=UPI003D7A437E